MKQKFTINDKIKLNTNSYSISVIDQIWLLLKQKKIIKHKNDFKLIDILHYFAWKVNYTYIVSKKKDIKHKTQILVHKHTKIDNIGVIKPYYID